MRILSTTGLAYLMAAGLLAAAHSQAANVEVFDRATHRTLPTYTKQGRVYVAGEPGHEYEIRIRNDRSSRMLAVATVDGVNVISGETGAWNQSGYVIDPYANTRIEGWRKSMSHTAAFYFTKLSDSYAARTGRAGNVGVIGVALFRERPVCCRYDNQLSRSANESAPATPAPTMKERDQDAAEPARKAEAKLGTGHGRSEYSSAQYTEFERASSTPDETIVIYYDSERNLIAQGIIAGPRVATRPNPFPNSFVPDP